jgi:hypothetical protein
MGGYVGPRNVMDENNSGIELETCSQKEGREIKLSEEKQ